MDKLIIASMRQNAGKTGLIVGLATAFNKKFGYMKPLGDRLLYRKKQLWDHDAAVITGLFGLTHDPMHMSLGFDHSKLRFMYDEASTRAKLLEAASQIGQEKELLLVEGGKDMAYGLSIHLDACSIAESIGAKLLLVVSGDEDAVLDDLTFAKKYIDTSRIALGGVIVNKLPDPEAFKNSYLSGIQAMGLNVLGMIPYTPELTRFSMGYLADRLFAKVVSGTAGLARQIDHILVGAMSVDAALKRPDLKFEDSLVITGGDRADMIVYALESRAAGIILTNNIVPPSNIISMASERNIPLLLVAADTYEAAKQIDNLEPLLTRDDLAKVELWGQLVREHVDLNRIMSD